jgi:hypothetical protein
MPTKYKTHLPFVVKVDDFFFYINSLFISVDYSRLVSCLAVKTGVFTATSVVFGVEFHAP